MRPCHRLLCAILGVAVIGTAQALAATPVKSTKLPSGMGFNFDAQHDQITATGVQLKPSPMASPSITPTTGTITVTINIKAVSTFRPNTEFHCSLAAIGGLIDTGNGTVAGGFETANVRATPNGAGTATCTLTIPYSWSLPADPSADTGLVLAFGVSAVREGRGDSSQNQVIRSTLQVDGIENLPANGATSMFTFDVAL